MDDDTRKEDEFDGDAGAGADEAHRELDDLDRSDEMESQLDSAREGAKDADLPDLPGIPDPSEVESDPSRKQEEDEDEDETPEEAQIPEEQGESAEEAGQ